MRDVARRIGRTFSEEMERNFYIEAVAEEYHVGISQLKQLVAKMAIETGGARPVERPRSSKDRKPGKEDGILTSQKLLLTWLISDENLFRQIEAYISPDDFTGDLYKTVASLLYKQYADGQIQPAQIMNHFTDEEEHRQVASLFHTSIKDLKKAEEEKALEETILRIKRHSIEEATRKLDPTDMAGLQKLMIAKKKLQELKNLHISVS